MKDLKDDRFGVPRDGDRITVALTLSLADLARLVEEIPTLLTRHAEERTHVHSRLLLAVRHAVEELG